MLWTILLYIVVGFFAIPCLFALGAILCTIVVGVAAWWGALLGIPRSKINV